jgi:hypothetical protein
MSRSPLAIFLVLLIWAASAKTASAAAPVRVVTANAHASKEKADVGVCGLAAVICVGGEAIKAGTGVVGGIVGDGAEAVAGGVMGGAVDWVAKGAGWLIEQIAAQVDRSTKPALDSEWFQSGYAAMARLSIALAPLFLLLAVGQALLHQQMGILVRALSALPIALILTFAAVTLVQLALGITDWLTTSVLSSAGDAPTDAFRSIGKAFSSPDSTLAGFVLFLTAILMSVLALAVWIELALREAAIYVAVAFLPLTFVAMVWRATTIWCRRLAEGLVAVILSKFALAVAFTLAAGALGESGQHGGGGLSAIVAGGAVLLLAAVSPFVLLRMIPLTQSAPEQGVSRQHIGGAARSVPGATMATGATRMLMYGKFTGGAAPLPASASGADSPVPAAARRGAAPADVPVAVIPDPRKPDVFH